MSTEGDRNVFANVSRPTTQEERARIESIELDPKDLDAFMDKLRRGMIQAASAHQHAVQNNFALRVETAVRISRPVYVDGKVQELVGEAKVVGEVDASKHYKKS